MKLKVIIETQNTDIIDNNYIHTQNNREICEVVLKIVFAFTNKRIKNLKTVIPLFDSLGDSQIC